MTDNVYRPGSVLRFGLYRADLKARDNLIGLSGAFQATGRQIGLRGSTKLHGTTTRSGSVPISLRPAGE